MSLQTETVGRELRVTRGIYVSVKLLHKAEEEAKRRSTSVNKVIEDALRFYFEVSPFFTDSKALDALHVLLSMSGPTPELERVVKALSEVLTKEKKVNSGG